MFPVPDRAHIRVHKKRMSHDTLFFFKMKNIKQELKRFQLVVLLPRQDYEELNYVLNMI